MNYILDEADVSDTSDTPSELELLAPVAEVAAAAIKKFNFNAKRVLLTYSTCNEDPDDILAKLDARHTIARAVGAIELHADGTPHVHLAIEYERKLHTTNSRFWDYQYNDECDISHPNVSSADRTLNWKKCINYCRGKGKTWIRLIQYKCTFQEALDQADADQVSRSKPDLFEAVSGKTRSQWIQWCYENHAAQFMEPVWKHVHRAPDVHTLSQRTVLGERKPRNDPRFDFMVMPDLSEKPLVLCGPSGIGKTTWAVDQLLDRYGPILFVNEIDQVKKLDFSIHKCVLFDEIRWTGHITTGKGQWPLESQIAVCDLERDRSIHCRHSNGALPAYFPRVFTSTNYLPFSYDEQIERRITIINMYNDRSTESLWLQIK
jgi:hypothetical protein